MLQFCPQHFLCLHAILFQFCFVSVVGHVIESIRCEDGEGREKKKTGSRMIVL